ncbi:hypothetical protein B0H13DRAFT_2243448 [Mycena leptocephala]|nr:hypothetical protein B0H13DRAFT_2243448 [Mycena leptocephala]
MLTWAGHQDEYLDEVLRLEGRGYPPSIRPQTCYGPSLFCQACIVKGHTVLPTHWIQEWNGSFFERRALKDLGLVIQLGHPPGSHCPNPLAANKDFCLIDVTGVHTVAMSYCLCDSSIEKRQQLMRVCWWPATARDPKTCATFPVVRLFQIMNCLGKVSAHDFLRSLELLTNNDGLDPPPDRRRAFRHIVRQYRTIQRLKRAGRGHHPSGVNGTAQGELALQCRACPQDGKNLPPGWNSIKWEEMPEDQRYKYFLFLAQDCNFRLINRNVGSAAKDPIVGDGFGYFVNQEKYTEFLGHIKRVKGLRTTGVGGVTCARHNMWRPNGIGDLQLGERYCNMDFILFSALMNTIIFYLILSYDIACQYSKNFWARMLGLPTAMHLVIEQARVCMPFTIFIPLHVGWGRTHGETVEQNWEFTNGAAASTKMMGLGTRHATLEDLFGFHNWRRLVSWRSIFKKRMGENVKEGQVHRDAFEAFDAALRGTAPEMVEGWQKWVDDWESRQHKDGAESPFEVTEKVMSMREIRLKLAKEELLRSGEGVEVEQEDTPSTFVLMGLEIEESQRYLAIDVKSIANPTDTQTVDILKRRAALVKRMRTFRKLQRTYMPNLRRFLTASQRALWDSEMDRNAEAVRLFLPSDISDKTKRENACAMGLPKVEADLRIGEAREALESLRRGLRARTMTNRFRLRHCTGQRVLRQINLRIHRAKDHGPWEKELQVLEDRGGCRRIGAVAAGESKRTLSWIWYTATKDDPTEKELVEEWCKAYARMRRWHEDVVLVEEEMHRTIEYGYWSAVEWVRRIPQRAEDVSAELLEGLTAYGREQEARELKTCEELTEKWAAIRLRGRAFLAKETPAGIEVVVPLDDDERERDEGSDEEEEGLPTTRTRATMKSLSEFPFWANFRLRRGGYRGGRGTPTG